MRRLNYYRRIFSAYLRPKTSQLEFWHETPDVNEEAVMDRLGPYYMSFTSKANYSGPYDSDGIPLLDYKGVIGLQYNPIAIAQYGLGNYNVFVEHGKLASRDKFLLAAEWLVDNLVENEHTVWVWQHYFDWDYRTNLEAPWHSGLAQGQGLSLLVRAYSETQDEKYIIAAGKVFSSFYVSTDCGGVVHVDAEGYKWIEEYIVSPPTHILNGFIWSVWGLYDYFVATRDRKAEKLFGIFVNTLSHNLKDYDVGYWSLYEQSGTKLSMLASPFYHSLHIVQLRILHNMTNLMIFEEYASRWELYKRSVLRRYLAFIYKALFKLLYY